MNTQALQRDQEATDGAAQTAAAGSGVRLKDRFQIWSDAPIPAFDSPSARAYSVTDLVNGNEGLFALVSDGQVLCRDDVIANLSDVRSTALMRLVDSGYVW
jgi:eukaryotic-like serine/threonine-protein kinase